MRNIPINVVIQARTGSNRLPGKILRPINGLPMLAYQINRLKTQAPELNLILATSNKTTDQPVLELGECMDIPVFAGDEDDVLGRFKDLAISYQWPDEALIVRLTGDCPLSCPDLINKLIRLYQSSNADYGRIDTDTYPRGVDAEIFTVKMLINAAETTQNPYDREHVTSFFYRDASPYHQVS